ncbi:kinase-like domain-containing protein [Mycena haematopus]|nr:kinase-like domain-containing protein [Mycena haematopus]
MYREDIRGRDDARGSCRALRRSSAPPFPRPSTFSAAAKRRGRATFMLSVASEDDEWHPQPGLYRAASVGNSWGVTSIGRGFDWSDSAEPRVHKENLDTSTPDMGRPFFDWHWDDDAKTLPLRRPLDVRDVTNVSSITSEPYTYSPSQSRPTTPPPAMSRSPTLRSPTLPARPRRRSSQQRVSLIAGRVSIATIEPSSPPFLGGRDISEFDIDGEIGRGAYGLVKRAREILPDHTRGPPLIIKQIIKSRILADCWKKHPKHGTIPIEIYVMSSISHTTYVLPPRRPWDPLRASLEPSDWTEGKIVNGHPNICPLLDFFEDNHYYYLVLPSTLPQLPDEPKDLFDLVENFPHGLPPHALAFLHERGIVHRDVKDENVILGPHGKCILIDFGRWDTFSGTLDYAGPEILRGERYEGKPQDVWAFGVVAYVLLVGECPFMTPAEAQDGLESPFANASIALDERCEGKERDGEEPDGGGASRTPQRWLEPV